MTTQPSMENQFDPQAVERLSVALQARGYHVLVFMASPTKGDVEDVMREIMDYQVDGIVLASVSYGWGSRKFLTVCHEIRAAFDVQDEAYTLVVSDGLATIYNDRAILVEFAIALVAVLGLQLFVPIPIAIPVGEQPIADVLGTTIQYADVLQHVVGLVVLLYIVTGIHMVSTAMRLLYRLSRLPLVAPQVAAIELDDLADFSGIAATMWFLVVVLMVVVYQPWFGRLFPLDARIEIGFWVVGTAAALLLVGVAIFLVPQILLHAALVRRKRDRLMELDEELDALVADLRAGDRDPNSVSVALDLHEKRRERVKNTRTWLIDSRRLLHLVSSGIAATVSVVAEVAGLPWV